MAVFWNLIRGWWFRCLTLYCQLKVDVWRLLLFRTFLVSIIVWCMLWSFMPGSSSHSTHSFASQIGMSNICYFNSTKFRMGFCQSGELDKKVASHLPQSRAFLLYLHRVRSCDLDSFTYVICWNHATLKVRVNDNILKNKWKQHWTFQTILQALVNEDICETLGPKGLKVLGHCN